MVPGPPPWVHPVRMSDRGTETTNGKAAMDNLARVRHASVQVARVQRRIWLLQTLLWPVVALCGVAVAVVVARRLQRRRPVVVEAGDATVAPAAPVASD